MESTLKRIALENVKLLAARPWRSRMVAAELLATEDFWALQRTLLVGRYQDAVQHVPFYRDSDLYPPRLPEGASLGGLVNALPVLPKATVKAQPQLFHRKPASLLSASHTTGGTTGTPLRVKAGLSERGATQAILECRYAAIAGTSRPRIVRLTGYLDGADDRLWHRVPGTDVAYLSIYRLHEARRAEIVAHLRDFGPQLFYGYASALAQLARILEPADLRGLPRRCVVVTSETLEESGRAVIEAGLDATVYNDYGSQEGQHLVMECAHRGMHVHPYRGVVEILGLDSDDPAEPGVLGRVVVTGLVAREMPLLRYDLGDTAVSAGGRADCACGSGWPMIGMVYGRREDLVKTPDGRLVGMLSYSTLKDVVGVRESQIVQRGYHDFQYRIRSLPDLDREKLELHVRQQLRQRLGYRVDVEFDYVNELDRGRSGKLKAVVVEF